MHNPTKRLVSWLHYLYTYIKLRNLGLSKQQAKALANYLTHRNKPNNITETEKLQHDTQD